MSSTTKPYEEKMNASVNHLVHELAAIRAGRANPAILDKVAVDYYGSPTPINQIAAVAVAEARILTITPWDRQMLKPISKAIQTSDIGIKYTDMVAATLHEHSGHAGDKRLADAALTAYDSDYLFY